MKDNCVNCFKVVSVKSRFKLFNYLKNLKKKADVSCLVKLVGLRQPTVTFHLNQLVKRGFVRKIKAGRNVYCQIHKNAITARYLLHKILILDNPLLGDKIIYRYPFI